MSNMLNLGNLKDKLFQKVDNVVWDIQSGKIGIKRGDNNIVTLKETPEGAIFSENPLDLSMTIPAFAIRTKVNDIKAGDLVVGDDYVAFALNQTEVDGVGNPTIRLMRDDGVISTQAVPSNTILGMNSVLVVKNIFTAFGGSEGGMKGMLPLLLMMKGGNMDTKTLLLMSMMSGGEGMNLGDSKSLLPLLLMQEGGNSMEDLLPLMLMQGGEGMDMQSNPLLMMALLGKGDLGSSLNFGSKDMGMDQAQWEAAPKQDVPNMGRNRDGIWRT